MEDFPIWLKASIYVVIGATVPYTVWGIIHSALQ